MCSMEDYKFDLSPRSVYQYVIRFRASSSMTGGNSKLSNHFQALEKMNVSSSVRALSSEDLQQARHAANRILQYVTTQGMTRYKLPGMEERAGPFKKSLFCALIFDK